MSLTSFFGEASGDNPHCTNAVIGGCGTNQLIRHGNLIFFNKTLFVILLMLGLAQIGAKMASCESRAHLF
jgi:hypothetical protein